MTHGRKFLESRLNDTLENGDKLFVPYIMAGDGGLNELIHKLQFLSEAGASAIEVGIPFSDPVADGPTIQEAGKRALEEQVTLYDVINTLKANRHLVDAPIIFMTYLNPIFKMGIESFVHDAKLAGVDGLIIPDLPYEQQTVIQGYLKEADIALIQLVSLTSSEQRIKHLAEASEGFTYAITVNGITGARSNVTENLNTYFKQLKQASSVPVLAGFGISTPEHVKQMSETTDGVIVGSKIVELFHQKDYESIKRLIDSSKSIIYK
ncbi:tryptophan synthase subunit alpha [Aquisalibacillus elongatus]|uniref:Tryptophan synthase alpha chain n=1 Tax=Aquisalibacillus elongatus TaxID=485577 RepID=A0A3N5BD55_9BACI|nr:tryptophan synthase subunit alpha [Aquisalibacillus elongatus]RPF53270.1 tryptophan synthase alpha chain [Aquisalibacillus elongatus]